jgi:hypothetical protein
MVIQKSIYAPTDFAINTTQTSLSGAVDDPINARILAICEDQLHGFVRDPFACVAQQCDLDKDTVIARIRAMLEAGSIRRVRQTLVTTNLAPGALIAWKIAPDKLTKAFDYMFNQDPFSGHVVVRSADPGTAGAEYRLWTTLKVPVGFSLSKHCQFLCKQTGAHSYLPLPAKKLFALGVGHVRRRGLEPGTRTDEPARMLDVKLVTLNELEWRVVMALKREFQADEIVPGLWTARAHEADMSLEQFYEVAAALDKRKIMGRFSTFLEHVKKHKDGSAVTRYNALFHWAVPTGREVDAGLEVGRHPIMTHAYWREAGPDFRDVNIMGVAHGTDKQWLLDHKAAIDRHLEEAGIAVGYTNVFWGGRSEIKPSEIAPPAYAQWCTQQGIYPQTMRT